MEGLVQRVMEGRSSRHGTSKSTEVGSCMVIAGQGRGVGVENREGSGRRSAAEQPGKVAWAHLQVSLLSESGPTEA